MNGRGTNDQNLEISHTENVPGYMSHLAGWDKMKVPIKINFTKAFAKCSLDKAETMEYFLKLN